MCPPSFLQSSSVVRRPAKHRGGGGGARPTAPLAAFYPPPPPPQCPLSPDALGDPLVGVEAGVSTPPLMRGRGDLWEPFLLTVPFLVLQTMTPPPSPRTVCTGHSSGWQTPTPCGGGGGKGQKQVCVSLFPPGKFFCGWEGGSAGGCQGETCRPPLPPGVLSYGLRVRSRLGPPPQPSTANRHRFMANRRRWSVDRRRLQATPGGSVLFVPSLEGPPPPPLLAGGWVSAVPTRPQPPAYKRP